MSIDLVKASAQAKKMLAMFGAIGDLAGLAEQIGSLDQAVSERASLVAAANRELDAIKAAQAEHIRSAEAELADLVTRATTARDDAQAAQGAAAEQLMEFTALATALREEVELLTAKRDKIQAEIDALKAKFGAA